MIISTFQSVNKAYVAAEYDLSWREIVDLLTYHIEADNKERVPLYNLVKFKSVAEGAEPGRRWHGQWVKGEFFRDPAGTYDEIPGTVRRAKINVVSLHGIVLDYDGAATIEEVKQQLPADLEYVLYTTFRHGLNGQDKFRVVVPFSQPLLAADIAGRKEHIRECFPHVDQASFTVSQSFYFHSGNLAKPVTYWNEGTVIDPYSFEYREPKIYVPMPAESAASDWTQSQQQQYKQAVIASLVTCSNLHYHSNQSHLGVLALVSICRSIGCGFEEFDRICARIASADSTLQNPSLRAQAWSGWAVDRIRRETRDAFIAAYGGSPVKIAKILTPQQHQLREKYLNKD